jgi:Alkylmercury lyase
MTELSIPSDLNALRAAVYQTLAAEGRAPSIGELARLLGADRDAVSAGLAELAGRHMVVLNAAGDAVRMAHPFSAAPMAFVLSPADGHDDRRWWGGCAWDSFGISAALALDVLIDTACPGCGSHLRVAVGPDQSPGSGLAVRIPLPAAHWWDDVVVTCISIRLFCSHAHAADWSERTHAEGGQIVAAETMWRLSAPWYGDRLAPDYTPHTREQNQAILETCGLTGSFWRLP